MSMKVLGGSTGFDFACPDREGGVSEFSIVELSLQSEPTTRTFGPEDNDDRQ